jgi:ribosomal protein L4
LAYRELISERIKSNDICAADFAGWTEIKTKKAAEFCKKIGSQSVLLILDRTSDENFVQIQKSFQNLAEVKVAFVSGIRVKDFLLKKHIVCSQSAFQILIDRYLSGAPKKEAA